MKSLLFSCVEWIRYFTKHSVFSFRAFYLHSIVCIFCISFCIHPPMHWSYDPLYPTVWPSCMTHHTLHNHFEITVCPCVALWKSLYGFIASSYLPLVWPSIRMASPSTPYGQASYVWLIVSSVRPSLLLQLYTINLLPDSSYDILNLYHTVFPMSLYGTSFAPH